MYQQVAWLVKKEVKAQWRALAITFVVTIFLGLITSNLLEQMVQHLFGAESPFYNYMLLDVIFIATSPAFGAVFMSMPYLSFQTIKEDPFSKRMAFLRTLPIPVPILALSRMVFMMITLVVISLAFYVAMSFALSDGFFGNVTLAEYWMFVLFWFGYALTLGGINPVIEYGTNGKVLHIVPWFFIVIYFLTIFLFYRFMDQGVAEWVLLLIKSHGWLVAVIPLLVGVGSSVVWNKLLARRLARRDYL
ncbi:ABC-2 transporter permease [Bacillus sp. PS06]|uniref:ABC-2 transporter permease n=1 Tax=Bacillus sp. PS06 TaxID=2764176 RepID=UPI001781848C|nr:ABC-2 transporter permease [Bacillus sp. PS06]MBD8069829.1 ABC-2 transporter permease [Bacillus sp. PS06]